MIVFAILRLDFDKGMATDLNMVVEINMASNRSPMANNQILMVSNQILMITVDTGLGIRVVKIDYIIKVVKDEAKVVGTRPEVNMEAVKPEVSMVKIVEKDYFEGGCTQEVVDIE